MTAPAAKQLCVVSNTLAELKLALLAHLQLEDRELYPALQRRTSEKAFEERKKTVDLFSTRIPQISQALVEFLGRSSGPVLDVARFTQDRNGVKTSRAMRIQSEEAILHPLYEQLTASTRR